MGDLFLVAKYISISMCEKMVLVGVGVMVISEYNWIMYIKEVFEVGMGQLTL